MHRKGVRNEAERCVTVGSLKLIPGQAVDEIMASGMEDAGAGRARPGTGSTGLDRFHYNRVFRGDEVMQCSVLKNRKLTAGEMLKRKAESHRVRPLDEEQQAKTARLRSKVKFYERQAASCSSAVFSETEMIREIDLAAIAVIVERAALKSRKRSVTERTRECMCSAAQYTKKGFGLQICAYAAFFDFAWVYFQVR